MFYAALLLLLLAELVNCVYNIIQFLSCVLPHLSHSLQSKTYMHINSWEQSCLNTDYGSLMSSLKAFFLQAFPGPMKTSSFWIPLVVCIIIVYNVNVVGACSVCVCVCCSWLNSSALVPELVVTCDHNTHSFGLTWGQSTKAFNAQCRHACVCS